MPFLLAIMDLIHPLKNNRSSIGMIGCSYRLGDRSVTDLRNCVIIVAGLSTGLERADIELVVENQCNRLLSQQQDSKTLPASKGTTTADCGQEKKRRLRN